MALERFMIYVEGASPDRWEVVYCWGFRASLSISTKMAASLEAGSVVTVDLETLQETHWFGEADAADARTYRPAPGDPPMAGFLPCAPAPLKPRVATLRRNNHLLRRERDLHPRLTAWARVA